jgi:hypothetical protein
MTKHERYELMLRQALRECPVPSKEAAPSNPYEEIELRAPFLADILYRLSIEHGVSWNDFREEVLLLITNESPVKVGKRDGASKRGFAADLAATHSLIVLALDSMPPDPPAVA